MARSQTMVQLTDSLVSELDAVAKQRGTSRSALIREALNSFLEAVRSEDIGQQIVDGYTRVPPCTPDLWGSLDDFTERNTVELMQRLEAEERQAGHAPW